MKRSAFILALFFIAATASGKSYLVRNEAQFDSIHSMLKPGDEVIIANGKYTPWSLLINVAGTQSQPILIRAEKTDGVVFSGIVEEPIFKVTGSYIIVKGLRFTACTLVKVEKKTGVLVEMNNSTFCRLTECSFEDNIVKTQFMPIVIISGRGASNQVDRCTFARNADNQEVQVRVSKDASPQYTLIENNVFRDKVKVSWKNSNGGECVQVGQDPILLGTIVSNTTVRGNRFIKCNGEPEVISNKSSNNIYSKNYFEDCDGELVMRGGHDCIIDSNIIKGGNSGIRVNGTGHTITNNHISNVKTGIRLMYGMAGGKTEIGFYVAASGCTIKNNRIENAGTGIFIGDSKNADWTGKFDTVRYPSRVMQDVAPLNNTLGDNVFINTGRKVVEQ